MVNSVPSSVFAVVESLGPGVREYLDEYIDNERELAETDRLQRSRAAHYDEVENERKAYLRKRFADASRSLEERSLRDLHPLNAATSMSPTHALSAALAVGMAGIAVKKTVAKTAAKNTVKTAAKNTAKTAAKNTAKTTASTVEAGAGSTPSAASGGLVNGLLGFGRTATKAQVGFLYDAVRGFPRMREKGFIPIRIKNFISNARRKGAERELAAVEKALENARKPVDFDFDPDAMGQAEIDEVVRMIRAQDKAIASLEERKNTLRSVLSKGDPSPTTVNSSTTIEHPTAGKPPSTTKGAIGGRSPLFDASDYYHAASRELYGARNPVLAAVKTWASGFPDRHVGMMNTLGWGLLLAEAVGALHVASRFIVDSDQGADAAAGERSGRIKDAKESVAEEWNSATNSVNALSDARMVRHVLRRSMAARNNQINMLSGGIPEMMEAETKSADETLARVISSVSASPAFSAALDEADRRSGEWASREADKTYMVGGGGDYDAHLGSKMSEYRSLPPVLKVLTVED